MINIVVILLYIVVIALPVFSVPVNRQPLCKMSSNDILRVIQSTGHQFNVVGSDDSFNAFAESHIAQDGSPYGEKSKEFWILQDEETNDYRTSRKLHEDTEQYTYKPLCKSTPTYERRFNKFPFIRASWSCERNRLLAVKGQKKNFDVECKLIKETRPILMIKGGCQSFLSHHDEEWIHSTEEVVTGCQAVLKFSRNL